MTRAESAADLPVLWHIPLSHYSEKVRWALDYKGIAHRRETMGYDYLIRCWRATRQAKLPILWLDGRAIHDSTRIIAALEARYPEPPLYPRDPAARERALAIEDDLDETLGPALRAAFLGPLFTRDPDLALRQISAGWPGAYEKMRRLLPVASWYYKFRHKIVDANLEQDRATVLAALDRVERIREGRAHLVGGMFTVADLTATALLAPLMRPLKDLPAYMTEYREQVLKHPACDWAAETYRRYRGTSAAVPRRETARVEAA